jgi:hypothetical protein
MPGQLRAARETIVIPNAFGAVSAEISRCYSLLPDQSSTILPELPDFISSIASLNSV